jgi:hypothetical protein
MVMLCACFSAVSIQCCMSAAALGLAWSLCHLLAAVACGSAAACAASMLHVRHEWLVLLQLLAVLAHTWLPGTFPDHASHIACTDPFPSSFRLLPRRLA